MRSSVLSTASCFALCSAIAAAPAIHAQEYEHRFEPTVITGVIDLGNNGTADLINPSTQVSKLGGDKRYVVLEYDISSLTAADVEHAVIGGLLELTGPASTVPGDYEFTLYSANGLTDLTDVAGSVGSLSTLTYDRLSRVRFGFDVTTILKDRLNAGDNYIGIRIEGTSSSYPNAVVPKTIAGNLTPGIDLYVHETGTANDRPDPIAPGGPVTVVNNGGILEINGTSGNDIIFIQRAGSTSIRISVGGNVYTFLRADIDLIRADLYGGNDFFNDSSKSFIPAEVHAGGGNDTVFAGWGNDIIYGGNGNDQLRGSTGHDRLYGGDGVDTLLGQDGDDSLFGGFMTDTLTGGAGTDRFLVRVESADDVTDVLSTQDTEVHLQAADDGAVFSRVYDFGFWEDFAVERVDVGFDAISRSTENQAFLTPPVIDSNGKLLYVPLIALKRGPVLSGPADPSANAGIGSFSCKVDLYGTLNSYTSTDFQFAMYATIHEVGHTHEDTNQLGWHLERGWVSNPTSTTGLTQYPSGSTNYWHDASAVLGFVSDYADSAGNEDFAESFYAYVLDETNYPSGINFWPAGGTSLSQLSDLQTYMGEFSDYYKGVPYELTIWYQNFLGITNGTTAKNGVPTPGGNWSIDDSLIVIPSPTYGVQNYEFEFSETANTASQISYGIWKTEDINVSEYTDVELTLDAKSVGSLEASGPWIDWFVMQLNVDGVPLSYFTQNGNFMANNVYEQISMTVPPGAETISLEIWWQTNSGEKYVVDNIEVRGTLFPAPIAQ
ncbi:MAG: hypothetical protein AAGB34_01090 [Planctomycetota bacterium]